MNDCITAMWETAAQRDDLWSQARYEKFAQLIVLECASIVDTYGRWILYDKLAVKIKREFGVGE